MRKIHQETRLTRYKINRTGPEAGGVWTALCVSFFCKYLKEDRKERRRLGTPVNTFFLHMV